MERYPCDNPGNLARGDPLPQLQPGLLPGAVVPAGQRVDLPAPDSGEGGGADGAAGETDAASATSEPTLESLMGGGGASLAVTVPPGALTPGATLESVAVAAALMPPPPPPGPGAPGGGGTRRGNYRIPKKKAPFEANAREPPQKAAASGSAGRFERRRGESTDEDQDEVEDQ